MIFGIFYVLFAFLNQDHRESCHAYACQHCQSFVEQRRKARKWLSVKWILMSIIAGFIWLLAMVFSYENKYFSGNTVLIVSIVYAISWLISSYLWIKLFEINIRQQYQLAKMSFAPDLVLENLKIFPVGFAWSRQRGRFRMTASVRDVDYLQQLIEANQAQCVIHYSQAQLHKLEQTRPSIKSNKKKSNVSTLFVKSRN
ncbi:membrane protein [Candidatus Thiomargarita nelsonii]|uniref:Membrane protein n=1 Tax=Candidatus Thiomargarita nelsonii TaxID=1003181 RepID=A0A176RUQ0_9GAMM|nr:membrane protein [Candidatus Thiomargarita nelsonii]